MAKKNKKSSIDILKNKIEEMDHVWYWNYHSGVSYDYTTYRACSNGSDCCDNDYCRCGVIQNAHVDNIDSASFINVYTDKIEDELLCYCIDRIIVCSGITNPGGWKVLAKRGYYGEEIDKIVPPLASLEIFQKALKDLVSSKNDFERLKIVLEAEYGHLIPSLANNDYKVKIENVPAKSIKLGNDDYMKKIDKKSLVFYKDYTFPRAVCFHEGKYYRVIDGYHRTTAALQNKLETIKIISLEKTDDDIL